MDFQILLLGPPEIRFLGKNVQVQRRMARSLLYYLAARGGKIGRDELLPLFWENQDDQTAHQRLRDTLTKLRHALPDPDLLQADTSLVGLDFDQVYTDQGEFLNLLEQAGQVPWQIPPNEPLPERSFQLLDQAARLWRSPRYLAGADFPSSLALDEWRMQASQAMEYRYGLILERLSDHAFAIGDPLDSMLQASQALQIQPLNDELHYRILRGLLHLGRFNEANEFYLQIQDLLRRELDAPPSSRLTALIRRIQGQQTQRHSPKAAGLWKVRTSLHAPFVGRKTELQQLQRAFHQGGAVFLRGEAGQGKTRLMQEFTQSLEPPPHLLLAVCKPTETGLPFQPLISLFRAVISPEEWQAIPAIWAGLLALLVPEIVNLRAGMPQSEPAFPAELPASGGRNQLLEGIRQLFLLLSQGRRLILCLEDAQWADEATLAAIAYLIERPPFNHQAFLLVASRCEEASPRLDSLLQQLQENQHVQMIQLEWLNREEAAQLALAVAGYSLPEPYLQQLAQETGGNPFFVLESLRVLIESNAGPEFEGPVEFRASVSAQALISGRINQLDRRQKTILEAAAVLGNEFQPEIIAEVLQIPALEVAFEMEALEQRRLVQPYFPDGKQDSYRFIHNMIREVLLEKINRMRRRVIHRRTGMILESRAGAQAPDQAAILAGHFEEGGDYHTAFSYWLQAGQHALQLLSIDSANQAFARAGGLIACIADLSEAEILALYEAWAGIPYQREEADTLEKMYTNLLELGRARISPLLTGAALTGLSDACLVRNRYEQGLAYTNQAISYLERGGNLYQQIDTYIKRGVFLYMLGRLEEAGVSFQDALALGVDVQDPKLVLTRASAHFHLATIRTLSGWPESGYRHAQRSLAYYQEGKLVQGQIEAYSALAMSAYHQGNYRQALRDGQMGIELAVRARYWRMLNYLKVWSAMAEVATGHVDRGLALAEQAAEYGQEYGHFEIAANAYEVIGDACFLLQLPHRALEFYQKAAEQSRGTSLEMDVQYRLGGMLIQTGQVDQGRQLIEATIAQTQESGPGYITPWAQVFYLHALQTERRWEEAVDLAGRVKQEAIARQIQPIELAADLSLGSALLFFQANPVQAAPIFEMTAQKAAEIQNPWLELQSLALLARALASLPPQDPLPQAAAVKGRITEWLQEMAGHILTSPYREAFQAYKEKALRSLSQ